MMMQQFAHLGQSKNSFLISGTTKHTTPSSILNSDLNRMRTGPTKNFVLDRERLFDDAIKQKIAANFLKDENLKLKTKVHILEGEMQKKERFIDELIQQQDSY